MKDQLKILLFLCSLILGFLTNLSAQDDDKSKQLKFEGDFRFRVEHDWNSIRSNGIKRDDRSRLRLRFRFGSTFQLDKHSSFAARLRNINENNPQDPHLTIGGNHGEFDLGGIGFEKLYYQFKQGNFKTWVGKNSIPVKKLNELFWNDNVYPEGLHLGYKFNCSNINFLEDLSLNTGHFIFRSNGQQFNKDGYLQLIQVVGEFKDKRLSLFPTYYFFKNVGLLPNGLSPVDLDYKILHLGSEIIINKDPKISVSAEYYRNMVDYSENKAISEAFRDQLNGMVIGAKYGKLKKKGDWTIGMDYAYMQRYSIVDYFAQNDWVRWNYSQVGSNAARLSNFQGVELKIGYLLKDKYKLIFKAYKVKDLIKAGPYNENGDRVRLDLDIAF